MTGRELMELQATLARHRRRRRCATARADLIRRVGLEDAAERRVGTYSRRHAPPPGPRDGAHPRARGALPRRADDRPGPTSRHDAVGRGAPPEGRGHHRLPHHAVPRGGRPARRPRRDHQRAASIVAEGTPGGAQGRGRRPPPRRHASTEATTTTTSSAPARCSRASATTARPTTDCHLTRRARRRRARRRGGGPRARRGRLHGRERSSSSQPTLDDVFVEKTGRHLEGAGGPRPGAEAATVAA